MPEEGGSPRPRSPSPVPRFRRVQLKEATERASSYEWRNYVVYLEQESQGAGLAESFVGILELLRERGGIFCVLERRQLSQFAAENGLGGDFPEGAAFKAILDSDKTKGLASKRSGLLESSSQVDSDEQRRIDVRAAVLSANAHALPPDKIYILHDFPADGKEAFKLLEMAQLDAVVKLTSRELLEGEVLTQNMFPQNQRSSIGSDVLSKRASVFDKMRRHTELVTPMAEGPGSQRDRGKHVSVVTALAQGHVRGDRLCEDMSFSYLNVADDDDVDSNANEGGPSAVSVEEREVHDMMTGDVGMLRMSSRESELCTMLTSMAEEMDKYRDWYKNVEILSLPSPEQHDSREVTLTAYENLMTQIPVGYIAPSVVLRCIVEAAIGTASSDEDKQENGYGDDMDEEKRQHHPLPLASAVLLDYGDETGQRVMRQHIRAKQLGEIEAEHSIAGSLVQLEREMFAALQTPRLLGQGALPLTPPFSAIQRSVDLTELQTFTMIDRSSMERAQKVSAFEEMLQEDSRDSSEGNTSHIRERFRWERIASHTLMQVLSSEAASVVKKRYFEATDELLLALQHPTPIGLVTCSLWDAAAATQIRTRVSFPEWSSIALSKDDSYTPRTLHALGTMMDMQKSDLAGGDHVHLRLHPADHSLIDLNGYFASDQRWLTVRTGRTGHLMGLHLSSHEQDSGLKAQFVMHVSDQGTRVRIGSRSGPGSGLHKVEKNIEVTHTLVHGLVVTHGSDGSVKQEILGGRGPEVRRLTHCVSGSVVVTRLLRDGTKEILLGSGSVVTVKPDGDRTLRHYSGRPFQWVDNEWRACGSEPEGFDSVDIETGARICGCKGGVVVTTHMDGLLVTRHADGTVIRVHGSSGRVLVEAPGLACSEFDMRSQAAPLVSGYRPHLRTVLPDGSLVSTMLHSKVPCESTQNEVGRIYCELPDGTEIVAHYGGDVVVKSEIAPWEPSLLDNLGCESIDHHLSPGVFLFNLSEGSMCVEDTQCNKFAIDLTKITGEALRAMAEVGDDMPLRCTSVPGVSVDLAAASSGIKALPIVRNPRPPRLFVYSRDGSAMELLDEHAVQVWEDYIGRLPQDVVCSSRHGFQQSFYVTQMRGRIAPHIKLLCGTDACKTEWMTRRLPTFARTIASIGPEIQATAPRMTVRRVWEEHPPLSTHEMQQLHQALLEWQKWREDRRESVSSFTVADTRSATERKDAAKSQAAVRQALRAAKMQKRRISKAKERESQSIHGHDDGAKVALTTIAEGADELELGHAAHSDEDSSESCLSSSNSDYDADAERWGGGAQSLCEEAKAAHKNVCGDEMEMTLPLFRQAMIQVLNRGVTEFEARERLFALSHRSFQRDSDCIRASFDDLLRVLTQTVLDRDDDIDASGEAAMHEDVAPETMDFKYDGPQVDNGAPSCGSFWASSIGKKFPPGDLTSKKVPKKTAQEPDAGCVMKDEIIAEPSSTKGGTNSAAPEDGAGAAKGEVLVSPKTTSEPSDPRRVTISRTSKHPKPPLVLRPEVVDLGVVAPGEVKSASASVCNMSLRSQRFRINYSAGTGILKDRAVHRPTGLLPAGLSSPILVQVVCPTMAGDFSDTVQVESEWGPLKLQVHGSVHSGER